LTEGVGGALGVAASTGTFPQVEECGTIVAIRSDFYETHPVFGMVVNQAVKRNEAQLWLVADKLGKFAKLPGAKTLLHRPGMELDVLNGLARVLLDEGLAHTEDVEGLAELQKALAGFDADAVAARTGVDADTLRIAAQQLAAAKKSAILLAYGLPYTAYSRELGIAAANLAILAGIPGRAGSGLYVCGEKANSQGAIDLGIVPQAGGLGAQAMLDAAAGGKLGALYVVGEDLLTSYPDRSKVERALDKVPFLVVQDIFLSPTAAKAHVVLPAASFAEKDGTFTNAERRIQRVRPGIPLPGQARTDGTIFAALIEKLGGKLAFTGPAAIFAEIARNVPAYSGINFNGIGAQGVVWGGEVLVPPRRRLQPVGGATPVEGAFQLLTGSALYHSGTVSTRAKGPQAVVSAGYVEFGREDAKALQLKDGDLVKVAGNGVELQLKAKVGNRLPKGVLFAPYHFAAAGINRLYKGEAAVAVTVSK
jgi:predicted molibdopterin-dependent oxidoreductase YjgC